MKRTLLKHTLLAASLASMGFAAIAQNLPVGGTVSRGLGFNFTNGNTMTVYQYSDVLATNWQSFNIGAGYRVKFDQPSAQAIALNRVTGTTASTINGQLQANGQVFLINPNGILFGQTAQVNVGALVATTKNISDAAITNAGQIDTSALSATKDVTNYGKINTTGVGDYGYVTLIGNNIRNDGKVTATSSSVLTNASIDFINNANAEIIGKSRTSINAGNTILNNGNIGRRTQIDNMISDDTGLRSNSIIATQSSIIGGGNVWLDSAKFANDTGYVIAENNIGISVLPNAGAAFNNNGWIAAKNGWFYLNANGQDINQKQWGSMVGKTSTTITNAQNITNIGGKIGSVSVYGALEGISVDADNTTIEATGVIKNLSTLSSNNLPWGSVVYGKNNVLIKAASIYNAQNSLISTYAPYRINGNVSSGTIKIVANKDIVNFGSIGETSAKTRLEANWIYNYKTGVIGSKAKGSVVETMFPTHYDYLSDQFIDHIYNEGVIQNWTRVY